MEPLLTEPSPSAAQTAEPRAELGGGGSVLLLSGDWIARQGDVHPDAAAEILDTPSVASIVFDATDLGSWDSALLAFVSDLRRQAEARLGRMSHTPQTTRTSGLWP